MISNDEWKGLFGEIKLLLEIEKFKNIWQKITTLQIYSTDIRKFIIEYYSEKKETDPH